MQRKDHVRFCSIFSVLLAATIFFACGCDSGRSGSSISLLSERQFDFTGEPQQFTVPPGVAFIVVRAFGARGGDGWNVDGGGSVGPGGLGGYVRATLTVTPDETLYVYVGGAGEDATTGPGAGGWNGGGSGGGSDSGSSGGGGGGASDIRRGGQALTDRILVAGGGGSGSGSCTSGDGAGGVSGDGEGGRGGEESGGNGRECQDVPEELDIPVGVGGTCSTGGSTGGVLGIGGTPPYGRAGGAGGGGGFGGGASDGHGGGGGSSCVTPVGSSWISHRQGARDGNGQVLIQFCFAVSDFGRCVQ